MLFIVGGLVGWNSARGSPVVQRAWPVFLRIQILATSATLSLVAAWRLTSVGQLLGPLATAASLAGSTALAVVAVLTALSAPSFQPIQLSVLYGYRSDVVIAAARWGWILAPLGLGAAALVR